MYTRDQEKDTQETRKARADHVVKCGMISGKKIVKRKPLTELCVPGKFTEDREEWNQELQRHCEEVCTDLEHTRKVQKERIEYFKGKETNTSRRTDAEPNSQLTWYHKA